MFKTPKERKAFYDWLGWADNRYQDGRALEALIPTAAPPEAKPKKKIAPAREIAPGAT